MKNHVVLTPRFSDFNLQGILKASIYLDLACEAQLAQMEPRYGLPLNKFTSQALRWHIRDFKINYLKAVKTIIPLRIEADVTGVKPHSMLVLFAFHNEDKKELYAKGTIQFDLVDIKDNPVIIPEGIKAALHKYGQPKD